MDLYGIISKDVRLSARRIIMDNLNDTFTIGQFASFNHISEQTLRYYDKIGLLRPTSQNNQTGYRYYNITQCVTLDIISHMKSLGIPLKDIKSYLDSNDRQWLLQTLTEKRNHISQQIKLLMDTQAVIDRKLLDYQNHAILPKAGIPFIEAIGKRTVFRYNTSINYYYNENSVANYEYMLHVFKNRLREQNVPDVYFYNVSSIMSKDNLLTRNFFTTDLFVFVNESDRDRFIACDTIAANTYLCMVCDDSKNETALINRLLHEIDINGYTICGDYICEVVSEFLSTRDDSRSMILKLQIPISFQ